MVLSAVDRGDHEAARRAAGDTPLGDVVKAGIAETDLHTCIRALRDAGWIAVQTESSGRLRLRLGRA